MHFANPLWFLLLLLLPVFWYRYRTFARCGAVCFSGLHNVRLVRSSFWLRVRYVPHLLKTLAFVFALCAIARPQAGLKNREVKSSGIDIMLAVDTSGSMRALDFELNGKRQNRLEVVKSVVNEFIQKRQYDRIGMVVFGTEAYTQCPLTLDHGILLNLLREVQIGAAGDSTAIGSALGVATKRLKDIPSKSKIVILLTDGVNNAGSLAPNLAADAAAALGIKVYTIGAGTREEAPFPVPDPLWGGERIVYQQVPIDEVSLKEISQKTGGQFFRATHTKELRNIYETIDKLEKTELKTPTKAEYEEKYMYFLAIAILFYVIAVALQEWRLRVFP